MLERGDPLALPQLVRERDQEILERHVVVVPIRVREAEAGDPLEPVGAQELVTRRFVLVARSVHLVRMLQFAGVVQGGPEQDELGVEGVPAGAQAVDQLGRSFGHEGMVLDETRRRAHAAQPGEGADVAAAAERCQWASFHSESAWFEGIMQDPTVVCLRPDGQSIAVFAGTDTD